MDVKFEIPKKLADNVYQLVENVKSAGKLRKGANEATKSVERGECKLVIIARDVSPPEIVMHLPFLAKERSIPYVFVPAKVELGAAAGLPVGTASITIVDAASSGKLLRTIVENINTILGAGKSDKKEEPKAEEKKSKPKPEAKAETKEEPKAEEKKSEPKAETKE